MSSPFKIAVINDEITQDFGHACEVAAREFGMQWIELRGMWNKNLLKLDAKEIEEARRILERNKLRVTDIASPLFKVDYKDAPKSKYSPKRDQFNADFTFDKFDNSFRFSRSRTLSSNAVAVRTPTSAEKRISSSSPSAASSSSRAAPRNALSRAKKPPRVRWQPSWRPMERCSRCRTASAI